MQNSPEPLYGPDTSASGTEDDVPRALSAYGEGPPLPPVETPSQRDAFERKQRTAWEHRSD